MNYKLALLFGVLVWMGIAPLYAVDTPPVMNGHDTSPKYYKETNTPVALFPDFTITDAENDDIKGLVIAFTSGNHTDQDILSFTDQNGITGSFDKTKGALVLSGAASPADYQTAVRSITYSNDAAPGAASYDQRTLTISLANADYFSQDSKLNDGHFYEYVNASVTWSEAKIAASAKTYYGLQGYLATVTSVTENSFILSKISNMIWLGGSDAASEGTWLWVTGPENGAPCNYVNWSVSEPNNGGTTGTDEDYLMMYSSNYPGEWNDIYDTKTYGYVVEYGGMSGETLKMTTTTTLNVVAPQPPVMNGNDTSPTYSTETSTPVALFPDFTITDTENDNIKGLVIAFTSGNHTDQDVLSFTNQNGITGTFDKSKGALVLTGDASPANYQAAVRSITYTIDAEFSSVNNEQRTLTISLANTDYFSQDSKLDDGHFYKYVSTELSWTDAKTAAASTTYYGLQGYLCTVTSAAENSFILGIQDNADGVLWLGGSDDVSQGTSEGIWKWVTGPEAGTTFYQGGTAFNGSYVNWGPSQPSNDGNVENYLQFFTNKNSSTLPPGKWNDRKNTTATGYIIEYGGMSGDPTINMTTTTTLNIDLVRPKAPGGVVDNLRVWFNANSGTTSGASTITNGNITGWEGQSRYKITVSDVAGDPAVVPNRANFNAVVSFDGDDAIKTSSTAPYTTYFNSTKDDNTAFLVKKTTDGRVEAGYGSATGTRDRAGYFERTSDNQRTDYGKDGTIMYGNTTTISKYVIARQDVQPGDLSLYLDGALEKQLNEFNSLAGSNDGYLGFGANPQDFSSPSTTDIAEYIIYAADLSDTEVKEVESYLALKYGISKTDDYLASDGSTIWSATDNTGYDNDIFGVGQDNASGLNQKVSRSANNTNGPILATTQDFTASNTDGSRTALGEGNFMLMGHNNSAENSFTSSFNGGTNNRSDRVWKVDEIGTVGDVYFAIPKTAITFPSGIPVLVISNDLTFDSSDDVVNLTDDGTYYWASINPDDGAYLAFATTTPGFTLSKSALTIGENAGTGTFTVVLDAQPLNDVVFKVTSDDANEATVDESTLTFTTANWNTPQTVTVTGVNDNIDRNDNATITVSVDDASSDDYFDALDDQTVAVTLTNDDTAGFTVSETNLTVPENAGTGTFTVVLNTEPTTDVVLDVVSDDTNEATVDQGVLTFTSGDWDTPQTVTVTGVDDAIDRNDNATITVSVNGASSDDAFDALEDQTVSVTLTNDDVAPTVSTTTATSITSTSVVMGGNMSDNGTAAIIETGVVYSSTNTTPAIGGTDVTKDANGAETGVYSKTIGSLTPNTKYYFQAYATNSAGTSYGGVQSFTTKQTQTITFNTLSDKTYGDSDFDPAATASSGLTVAYSSSDASVATVVDGKIRIVGAGSCTIYADQEGDGDYDVAPQVSQNLTIDKATLTVTAEDKSKTYGEANPTLTLSYSGFVNGEDKTVLTTEPTVSTTATMSSVPGTYPIIVLGGDADNYTFSYTNGTLTVNKADQTITFAALADKTYGDADFNLPATSSSGLDVTYSSSNTNVATVSGNTVTIVGAGTTTITASQAGDGNYNAASDVPQTLTINKADQTITFAALADKTYGDADFNLSATSSSGLDVTYSSSNTNVATVSGTTVTIVGAGTTTITASQAGDGNYNSASAVTQTLNVNKATLSVKADDQVRNYGEANPMLTFQYGIFVNGEDKTVLTTEPTVSTTATTSSVPGTYPIIVLGGDADNYTFSYTNGTLTVNKADQTIMFAALADKTYGDADFNLSATSSSGLDVTYSSSNTNVATVSGSMVTIVGVGSTTITASQAGDGNYNAASAVQQTLTINKADQTITFAALADKTYGDADFNLSATSSSGHDVTYSSSNTNVATVSGSTVTIVGAGSTTIMASQTGDDNYNAAVLVEQTLTVGKATLSVTADDKSKTYGAANPTLTVSYSGFAGSDSESDLATAPTATTSATTTSGAGTYAITASGGVSDNYTFSYTDGTLTVDKATLSVTADDQSKTYGDANPALTVSYSGFVGSDGASALTTAPTASTTATTTSGAGTYAITASGGVSDNYTFSYTDGTLTVDKATLSVIADDQSKTYGDANPTLTVSYSGFVGSDGESALTTVPTATTTATTTSGSGTYPITVSGGADNNYTFSYTDGTLTVGKVALSVTADDQSKTYGDANPALTVSYSGFVGSDGASALTTAPTATTSATTTSGAGTYPITVSGGADNNYTFSYTDGMLTVGKATLSVTADDKRKVYGEPNPALTVSYSGFVGNDSESDLDTAPVATTTATISSINGDYPITVSGGADNNYTFSYTDGTLTVGQSTQTITFDALSDKTYGDAPFDLTARASSDLTVTYSSSDESVVTISGSTVTIVGAGTATITASQAGDNNFNAAAPVEQTLTVGKATLSVTADDKSKTYGEANPTLTVSYSGFVGSDGESDLTTAPTATTTATTTSGAGTYAITGSGGSDDNYTFSYTDGTLTVGKAALSVTADDQSKTYGEANPTLTVSYSGFVGSDGESDLTTAPTATTTATTTSGAGTYAITVSAGVSDNYTFSYTNGTLTVGKAALSVTADDQSKTYGEANPALTVSYSGFVGNDSESDLDTAPVATTTATISSINGDYPITVSGGADNNYTFSYTDGTLTVGKSTQTITFDALSDKAYGDAPFDLTARASSDLTVTYSSSDESVVTISGSTVTIVGAGTATITASQAGDNNFNAAAPVEQTLTVGKATLRVTANNQSKTYGEANPALILMYSGFVGNDSESDLDIMPVASTTATISSGVGTCPITVTGGIDNNYTFSYTDGMLTIGKATLSVTADDQSRGYGEANPVLTLSYNGFVGSDSESDLDTAPVATTTATISSENGDYPISVSGGADNNYTFRYVDGTLTVGRKTQSITFNALENRTDEDAGFELNATSSSGLPVIFTSSDKSVAICTGTNGSTVEIVGVGSCIIYADQPGNSDYDAAPQVEQPLTVVKYIAGDTNHDGIIDNGEVAGDTDGDGQITLPEVAGDTNGDGTIDSGEVAGDTDGSGSIDHGEVAGDTDGSGSIDHGEVGGDTNGDGTIDNGEVAGDTNGDGTIDNGEVAGDTNGDGTIDNGEVAGDTNGDGQITSPEAAGDTNGDGEIDNGEAAGDTNGNGTIDNGETREVNPKTDHANIKYLFSPNGDGINDYWKIPNILDLGRVHVKIYDRWGNLLYESTDYQNNWNGTYNGNPVPEGAYIYFIITQKNGTQSGVVNLVR